MEQNPQRQIEAIKKYAPDIKEENIYIDYQSGKNFRRTEYLKLKNALRRGDTLIVKELDRLGRMKKDVTRELAQLRDTGVVVRILEIPTTLVKLPEEQAWILDMINNLLTEVLASVAEQERKIIKRRQREGIELAKKQGKYKGRKAKPLPSNFPSLYKRWKKGYITATEFTQILGYKSRSTTYVKIRQYEQEQGIGESS